MSQPCTTCFWYYNNIACGVDFSKSSESAFKFAYKTAKNIGCKLYIYHCVDTSGINSPFSQAGIEKQILIAKEKINRQYVSVIKNFDNYEVVINKGTPHIELLKFSDERNIDMTLLARRACRESPRKRRSTSSHTTAGDSAEAEPGTRERPPRRARRQATHRSEPSILFSTQHVVHPI